MIPKLPFVYINNHIYMIKGISSAWYIIHVKMSKRSNI